jgi:hypothetical protein
MWIIVNEQVGMWVPQRSKQWRPSCLRDSSTFKLRQASHNGHRSNRVLGIRGLKPKTVSNRSKPRSNSCRSRVKVTLKYPGLAACDKLPGTYTSEATDAPAKLDWKLNHARSRGLTMYRPASNIRQNPASSSSTVFHPIFFPIFTQMKCPAFDGVTSTPLLLNQSTANS